MTRMVEALCYKLEGRGFDSGWGYWDFSWNYSFLPHCGLGVNSAHSRNKYEGYFQGSKGGRCLGLTTLPPSSADYLETSESLNFLACNGIA